MPRDSRTKIIDVATRLLRDDGPAAVTTRAVALGAGVQPPMIYRLFGDKEGLLDAVAEHVLANYVTAKSGVVKVALDENVDPLEDLAIGWKSQIEFGLANASLFALLSDPARGLRSPAARSAADVLRARVHRIAEIGRLRVSEQRAVDVIRSAGAGTVNTLLATAPDDRDPGLAESMYAAVLREILTDAAGMPASGALPVVVAARATLSSLTMLTDGERQVLGEWLDRAIGGLQA